MLHADEGDGLLRAVELLRSALPPEMPQHALVGAAFSCRGASSTGASVSRAGALAALCALASELLAGDVTTESKILHPVQMEVIFRQIAHALAIIHAWGPSATSEEALDAALSALRSLLGCRVSCNAFVGMLLCAPQMRSTVGHLLSTLLALASAPMRLSGARRAACVGGIQQILALPKMDGSVLGFFLPGIATGLAELASGDEKAPTPLLVQLLAAMEALLLGCLSDADNLEALGSTKHPSSSPSARMRQLHSIAQQKANESLKSPCESHVPTASPATVSPARGGDNSLGNELVRQMSAERSSAWLSETATRLTPLVERICAASAASASWRTRLRLVEALHTLLLQCPLALQPCLGVLLEFLCACTRDDYDVVARAAHRTLWNVGQTLGASAALSELVRARFDAQLRRLPAVARGVHEGSKARAFAALSAQLELVAAGGGLRRFVASRLGAITTSLMDSLAMAPPEGRAIEIRPGLAVRLARRRQERQEALVEATPVAATKKLGSAADASAAFHDTPAGRHLRHARYSDRPFVHLRDARTIEAAAELCRTLGALGVLTPLVHQLLLVLSPSCNDLPQRRGGGGAVGSGPGAANPVVPPRAEALWILNWALVGAADLQRRRSGHSNSCADVPVTSCGQGPWQHQRKETVLAANEQMIAVKEDGSVEEQDVKDDGATASDVRDAGDRHLVTSEAVDLVATQLDGVETEECMLMLLEELLDSRVWHAEGPAPASGHQTAFKPPNAAVGMATASIAAPQGSMSSIGRQQATLLERESLLQVVGSAFDLLTVAVAASTDDAVSDDSAGAGGTVDIGSRAAVQVALRRMLFPLLERLGDDSLALSSASELTLCRICASLGDAARVGSVTALLATNADFLLDALGARLRRVDSGAYPHTAQVVQAVLEYGGERALPIAHDIIGDVLRLVDDATPLMQDLSGTLDLRTQQREAYLRIEEAHMPNLEARRPKRHALPPRLSMPHAHLVGWLRALHVLVLICAEGLEEGPSQRGAKSCPAGERAEIFVGGKSTSGDEFTDRLTLKTPGRGYLMDSDNEPLGAFFDRLCSELAPAALEGEDDSKTTPSEASDLEENESAEALDEGAQAEADERAEAEARAAEEQEAEAAKPPKAGGLALEALVKVEVLLLSGPPTATHILLDVFAAVLHALSPWPRALLPAAYPLWPPLLQLIGGADRSIASHAMRVLATAARCVGDELSSRVVSDAIAQILSVLRRHTSTIYTETPRQAGRDSLSSLLAPTQTASSGAYERTHTLGGRGDGIGLGLDHSAGSAAAAAAAAAAAVPTTDSRHESGHGRTQEALIAACECLRELCACPRAMRPKVSSALKACAPLLARHQPDRVQAEARSLCQHLAGLDADAVWLFFTAALPATERFKSPPAGLGHPNTSCLHGMCPVPDVEIAANARRVLQAVVAVDLQLMDQAIGQ